MRFPYHGDIFENGDYEMNKHQLNYIGTDVIHFQRLTMLHDYYKTSTYKKKKKKQQYHVKIVLVAVTTRIILLLLESLIIDLMVVRK